MKRAVADEPPPTPNLPSLFSSCSPCFLSTLYHTFFSRLLVPTPNPFSILLPFLNSLLTFSFCLFSSLLFMSSSPFVFHFFCPHFFLFCPFTSLSLSFLCLFCFNPTFLLLFFSFNACSLIFPTLALLPTFSYFFISPVLVSH